MYNNFHNRFYNSVLLENFYRFSSRYILRVVVPSALKTIVNVNHFKKENVNECP